MSESWSNEQTTDIFPVRIKERNMQIRNNENYEVEYANTERLRLLYMNEGRKCIQEITNKKLRMPGSNNLLIDFLHRF